MIFPLAIMLLSYQEFLPHIIVELGQNIVNALQLCKNSGLLHTYNYEHA